MYRVIVRKKKWKSLKKILLEMINDIITEYPDFNDFVQRKLINNCNREGVPIDEVTFLVSLKAKHLCKPGKLYIKSAYAIIRFVICFIKTMLSLCISKARSSLCISKDLVSGLLMQTCFIHDYLFYG